MRCELGDCLVVVLTDKEKIIDDLKIGDKLGANDHASITLALYKAFKEVNLSIGGPTYMKHTTYCMFQSNIS